MQACHLVLPPTLALSRSSDRNLLAAAKSWGAKVTQSRALPTYVMLRSSASTSCRAARLHGCTGITSR